MQKIAGYLAADGACRVGQRAGVSIRGDAVQVPGAVGRGFVAFPHVLRQYHTAIGLDRPMTLDERVLALLRQDFQAALTLTMT